MSEPKLGHVEGILELDTLHVEGILELDTLSSQAANKIFVLVTKSDALIDTHGMELGIACNPWSNVDHFSLR